jgi:hypothetical protein
VSYRDEFEHPVQYSTWKTKCHPKSQDVGKIEEFLRNKIEIDYVLKTAKFTQPVLLKSLNDEFELKKGKVKLPATAGSILSYKGEGVKAQKSSVTSGWEWASFCIYPSGQDWTLRILSKSCCTE